MSIAVVDHNALKVTNLFIGWAGVPDPPGRVCKSVMFADGEDVGRKSCWSF
jgi:hypothetical protein